MFPVAKDWEEQEAMSRAYRQMTGAPLFVSPALAKQIREAGHWDDCLYAETKPLPTAGVRQQGGE